MKLHALAPAKVNLGLFVGPARGDGRHEVATAIESVSLADELTLTMDPDADGDTVICPGVDGRNLVEDALAAIRESDWRAPPVRVEINKRIPIAAGMAGGSADAAAVLRLVTMIRPLEAGETARIAASLGSDVPSQLAPALVFARGAGDVIDARGALAPHALVLLPPRSMLTAAEVYAEADQLGLPRTADDLRARANELDGALKPGRRLAHQLLVNDLERAVVTLLPEVEDALNEARVTGADHAFVCGSGPAVAGLFWGEDASDRAVAAAAQLIELQPGAIAALPVPADFGMPQRI